MAIETLRPNADGTVFQWVVGPDPDDYTQIDEVTADDDTSYVSTAADTFLFHVNLGNTALTTETINSLTVYTRCMHTTNNDDLANSQIITVTRGTAYFSANIGDTLSYATYSKVWGTNPETSAAWGTGDINNLQIGMKRMGGYWGNPNRTTQMWVDIDYSAAGGSTFTKSIADTVNFSAAESKVSTFIKVLTPTLQLSTVEAQITSFIRNLTDSEQLSEAISILTTYIKSISDTEQFSDVQQRVASFVKSLSATENLSAVENSIIILIKSISDTINFSTAIELIASRIKTIADTINLTETLNRLYTGERSITDIQQLADSQQTAVTFIKVLTSTENLSSVEATVKTYIAAIAESLNLSSAIATELTTVGILTIGENLALVSVSVPLGLLSATQIKALIEALKERTLTDVDYYTNL